PGYQHRRVHGWPVQLRSVPAATRARAAAVLAAAAGAHQPARTRPASERDPRALTGFGGTGCVTLTLAGLGYQLPETGLQSWPTGSIGQATTGQLLGLRRIALLKPHLCQTVEHLRLTRSDAQGAFEAGRGATQIATGFLLPCRGQQCQHRAGKILVILQSS